MLLTHFPAFSSHVIIVTLLALLTLTSQQHSDCGGHEPCQGHRPRLQPSLCCPAQGGQPCRPYLGEDCDHDLGQQCLSGSGQPVLPEAEETGICAGRYNVRVTARETTNVTIRWENFGPADVEEYIILSSKDRVNLDTSNWNDVDGGTADNPTFRLKHLMPGTIYFVKISFWDYENDVISTDYSETLQIETLSVAYCHHGEHQYPLGNFTQGCEQNCTCHPNGLITCVDRCPGRPELPIGWEACKMVDSDNCCDYKLSCPPGHIEPALIMSQVSHSTSATATCTSEGQVHPVNTSFTSSTCGRCTCKGQGFIACFPECPTVTIPEQNTNLCLGDFKIVETDCCKTITCVEGGSDEEARRARVRNLFARNRGARDVTITLEIPELLPVCTIILEYSSSISDRWHHQTYPCCHIEDQGAAGSSDLQQATKAILTQGRGHASLKLTGLEPNTSYVLRVGVHTGQLVPGIEDEEVPMSDLLVVSTLTNMTSCYYSGAEILHGKTASSSCSQNCVCINGEITCQDLCEDNRKLVARSVTCPRHVIEEVEGECCPKFFCLPEDYDAVTGRLAGCMYNGMILSSDDKIIDDCQECRCHNATVHCQSACPPLPPPPEGCTLAVVSRKCCPEYICEKEVAQPSAAQITLLLRFAGGCPDNETAFQQSLQTSLTQEFYQKLPGLLEHIEKVKGLDLGVNVNLTCETTTGEGINVQVNLQDVSNTEEEDGVYFNPQANPTTEQGGDEATEQKERVQLNPHIYETTEKVGVVQITPQGDASTEQEERELTNSKVVVFTEQNEGMQLKTQDDETTDKKGDNSQRNANKRADEAVSTEHEGMDANSQGDATPGLEEEVHVNSQKTTSGQLSSRDKRDAGTSTVSNDIIHAIVTIILSGRRSVETQLMTSLEQQSAGSQMADLINNTSPYIIAGHHVALMSVQFKDQSFVCEQDFAYTNGVCELTKVSLQPARPPTTTLSAVNITQTSASLTWGLPMNNTVDWGVRGIEVEYREVTSATHSSQTVQDEEFHWLVIRNLETSMTSLTLRQLKPNQAYDVRLRGLISTYLVGQRSQIFAEINFTTKALNGSMTSGLQLSMTKEKIAARHAEISWSSLQDNVTIQTVVYKPTKSKEYSYQAVPDPQQQHAELDSLTPATQYEASLLLNDGMSLKQSTTVNFVTKDDDDDKSWMISTVVLGAVVAVLLAVLGVVFVTSLRRYRNEEGAGNEFENRGYRPNNENVGA